MEVGWINSFSFSFFFLAVLSLFIHSSFLCFLVWFSSFCCLFLWTFAVDSFVHHNYERIWSNKKAEKMPLDMFLLLYNLLSCHPDALYHALIQQAAKTLQRSWKLMTLEGHLISRISGQWQRRSSTLTLNTALLLLLRDLSLINCPCLISTRQWAFRHGSDEGGRGSSSLKKWLMTESFNMGCKSPSHEFKCNLFFMQFIIFCRNVKKKKKKNTAVKTHWRSYIIISVRDAPVWIAKDGSHLNWQFLKEDQKYSSPHACQEI